MQNKKLSADGLRVESFTLDLFTTIAIYAKLKELFSKELTFLFESAVQSSDGNFSYIVVGAKERVWHKNGKSYYQGVDGNKSEVASNPLAFLKKYYAQIEQNSFYEFSKEHKVGFVDGFIGYVGYDIIEEFEPVLKKSTFGLIDELDLPDFDMVRPKLIVCVSHKNFKVSLVSSDSEMIGKFATIKEVLFASVQDYIPLKKATAPTDSKVWFDKEQFEAKVAFAKEMIKSGDVFQLVVSNRNTVFTSVDPFSYYRVLRTKNPSPYMYLLEFEDFSIAGSSPEVMIRLSDGEILIRPIAGTRKRGRTHARDLEMEAELLGDEKEIAEHIMLVDLARNDIGRVSKTGSVVVENLMRIERYSHVMHIVSDVVGKLDEKHDMFDLFAATFTAGTMTGAPKIRAMQLIAGIERKKRGVYSGSIGYFGFDGNMDSAITIRTAVITDELIAFQAAGGVVADSKPELEYLEITNKMAANRASFEELL